jgi:Protein of unknown function (DUF2905)
VNGFGKILIGLGLILVLAGVAVTLARRAGLPLGRLPGDIVYRGKNTTFYFPLVTCIVLSILFSVIMWIIGRFTR